MVRMRRISGGSMEVMTVTRRRLKASFLHCATVGGVSLAIKCWWRYVTWSDF